METPLTPRDVPNQPITLPGQELTLSFETSQILRGVMLPNMILIILILPSHSSGTFIIRLINIITHGSLPGRESRLEAETFTSFG